MNVHPKYAIEDEKTQWRRRPLDKMLWQFVAGVPFEETVPGYRDYSLVPIRYRDYLCHAVDDHAL